MFLKASPTPALNESHFWKGGKFNQDKLKMKKLLQPATSRVSMLRVAELCKLMHVILAVKKNIPKHGKIEDG